MDAQGQRKRRQLFQRNHTRDNMKIAFDLSNNASCERTTSTASQNLAELEIIAQNALSKWQKRLLYSSFHSWGVHSSDNDIGSRIESPEL